MVAQRSIIVPFNLLGNELMATAKKTTAKKTTVKKTTAKTTAIKASADKVVNVYLGLLGKGIDVVQDNIESVRKDSGKQVSMLEKRGMKLRKALTRRVKGIDVPEMDAVVRDTKRQISKAQNQVEKVQKQMEGAVEDAIGSSKVKRTTAPKRKTTARKAA